MQFFEISDRISVPIDADTDLVKCLLHEADAAAVDWLAVGEEALLQRSGHRGEALQQREQVLVIILKMENKENPS